MKFNFTELPDDVLFSYIKSRSHKDEIILSFGKLALSIAKRYEGRRDDLICAALEGICVAVDKIIKGRLKHDNVKAYVMTHICFSIRMFLRDDTLMPKHRPVLEPLSDYCDRPDNLTELYDILQVIAKTPLEKEIIRLRAEGLKDQQIAEQVGHAKHYVRSVRKNLKNRFLEIYHGDG